MGSDPNWLLSTTAQCTAAFVAIVGGFLVSRLVALSTERQGLRRHFDGLHQRRRHATSELASVSATLTRGAKEYFFAVALDDYVRTRGQISPATSLRRHHAPGASTEQLRTWSTQLAADVISVFEALETQRSPSEHDDVVETYFDHDAILKGVTAFIAREGSSRRTHNRRVDRPQLSPDLALPELTARQQSHLERERHLTGVVEAIEAEIELIEEELSRLKTTPYVWPGLAILAAFAVTGAVVPLAMLSRRPVPASPLARNTIVVLFTVGVLSLFGYLVALVRAIKSDERATSQKSTLSGSE